LLGSAGLKRLAAINHSAAVGVADVLGAVPGVEVLNDTFFNEFTLRLSKPAGAVADKLAQRGVLGGVPVSRFYPREPELAGLLLVAVTETNSEADIAAFAGALEALL
ncbi:MAG: glycine dehydrogenase, partial [Proteobacteria bacterium]|nr:glycine dehydrogenase [Pseudomonadota bacterium]